MSLSGPTVVASGGDTVQDIGGYRIHTFTTVGTSSFTVDRGGQVEVLVVAGGGGSGGGQGGGGGGGGVIYNNSFNVLANSINVTVGGGGSGGINIGTAGSNGVNSIFSSLTGFGGGGGGGDAGSLDGLSGGSGGGSGAESTIGTPGTGTPGQGNSGGAGSINGGSYGGGGGGGAGVVGGNGTGINGGKGGDGLSYTISGSSVYYGGGGGGGVYNGSGTAGIGGLGGGGNGAALGNGQNGVANTGGGGGGGGTKSNGILSNGGSGIVIVRYLFGAAMAGPQPQIFLAPLLSYPTATGTPPSSDGTKLTFTRASSQYLNFGSQTFDMTKGFSVTCRFAFTGTAGNYERLFDFGGALNSASNNITIMRYGTGAGFRVWIVNGTTAQNYYDVNYGIVQGEITNLAAVYDPNAAQPYWSIYKNGIKLVPSNVTFVSKATGTRTLAYSYVGNSLFNWDAYTNADIYSLNVYNRVLTANELVGPVAPSPWGIFTSTPNGLTADQAAVSGFALKQGYPGYGDGVYWINCGGVPQQTYCLMNPKWDGGGWMLIMKAAQGSTFNWGSTHWTTTSTLNPTDTTTTVANAKFAVFNSVPVTDVMAVWPTSDIGAVNTGGSLAVSDGWVWLVKNWYTSAITPLAGFQIDRDATPADIFEFSGFSTTSPIWSYQTGLRSHVFGSGEHIAGPDTYITRWGFLWNNEIGTTNTQDAFAGIGLNAPSSSGGDFWFWTGVNKRGFNRNIAWLMYGR